MFYSQAIFLKYIAISKEREFRNPRVSIGKRNCFTSSFLLMDNLRSVHLSIYRCGRYEDHPSERLHFLTSFRSGSRVAKPFPSSSSNFDLQTSHIDVRRRDTIMNSTIKRLFKKIGVRGRCMETKAYLNEAIEVWRWEAPVGTYMNWTQDLGRV